MTVQFGRWNFEGQPPAPDYIEKVSAALAPYGPDSNESYSEGAIRILYRAFHTTKESRREKQPHISLSGAVITWDGRLDNRANLISELRDSATVNSTDVVVVAAAYEKWGPSCLGKLIGDWALSIWNPRERSVLLAKDPLGTKHLYYSFDNNQVTWSTILDPLVRLAGKTFEICEEYIAGWFAIHFPATHLTPYVGIHSVPPSSSVFLRPGKHIVSKYWDFDPGKRFRYRTDAEYEEHFRSALATAVQRRLRSDLPVLAELSGGMDSSSIVCMADVIIARGAADCPCLDTISWFNNSQPATDELPYITKVEEKRGRNGCHIDLGTQRRREESHVRLQSSFMAEFENDRLAATPISNRPATSEIFRRAKAYMMSQGHRVTLSGLGGDSVTGGVVPTPTPELQNLLARARFFTLARQLNAWATKMRKSRLLLLWEAVRGFCLPALAGMPKDASLASWLNTSFVRRNRTALRNYPSRVKLFGPLPSFQDHLEALDGERRLMEYCALSPEMLREARYPYLDRDFLEFMYAIPREQIVRVGQRRFLMKRALVGIVPDEVLHRRKKTFLQQELQKDNPTECPTSAELGQHIVGSSIGIIDSNQLLEVVKKVRRNEEVPISCLMRTLTLESWLRHLAIQGVLTDSMSTKRQGHSSSLAMKELRTSAQPKSSVS